MSKRAVGVIFRKELRESLRDRKTIMVMVLLPLLLYPLLFLGMSTAAMMQEEKLSGTELSIGVAGSPPEEFRSQLAAVPASTMVAITEPERAINEGSVDAALRVRFDAQASLDRRGTVEVDLLYDGGSDRSREAKRRLEKALRDTALEIQNIRLSERGLKREFIEPIKIESIDVAPPLRQGGWLLGQILPMLICLLMIGATFYPAIDLTAGEKERGTLQTLLTAPISPTTIVVGKYLAVVGLALLTALVNLIAIGLVLVSIPIPDAASESLSFEFGWDVFLLSLVCLVLIGMVFGALMMAVAVTAKSFKEAQNYLTPLYLVCVFPLMVTGLPGIELNEVTAIIPLVNLALTIKQLLVGSLSAPLFMEVLITTLAWITLAIMLAARVFRMESVLLGQEGLRALFVRRNDRSHEAPQPTAAEACTLLGVTLLLLFYVGMAMRDLPIIAQVHVTQWGLLLLPTIGLLVFLRVDMKLSLKLRRPPTWALLSALLLGAGLWLVATFVLDSLGQDLEPVSNPAIDELHRQFVELAGATDTAILLFMGVALAPAICEEFLFRGVVLGAFRTRLSPTTSVGLSALLFALFHLNIYQLPTTFVVGLVLGALTLSAGSIWPAVLLHFLHNGLALGFQLYAPHIPEWIGILLLLLPAIGLILLFSNRSSTAPAPP